MRANKSTPQERSDNRSERAGLYRCVRIALDGRLVKRPAECDAAPGNRSPEGNCAVDNNAPMDLDL